MEELERSLTEAECTYFDRLLALIGKEISISEEIINTEDTCGIDGLIAGYKAQTQIMRKVYAALMNSKKAMDEDSQKRSFYQKKDVDNFLEQCYEAFKDGDRLKRGELNKWNNVSVAERKRFILSSIARAEHDKRVNYSAYQSAKRRLEDVSQEKFNFSL